MVRDSDVDGSNGDAGGDRSAPDDDRDDFDGIDRGDDVQRSKPAATDADGNGKVNGTGAAVDDVSFVADPEGLGVDEISELLDDDRVGMALIVTAARLERELGFITMEELDLSHDTFLEDWAESGLGKMVRFNEHMGWIEEDEPIRSLAGLRTDIIHNYEEIQPILADPERRQIVAEIVRDTLEIIETRAAERAE